MDKGKDPGDLSRREFLKNSALTAGLDESDLLESGEADALSSLDFAEF